MPAGTEFRGEGILAVTKALLECGVGYVAGYQGSAISHLMDVLANLPAIVKAVRHGFELSEASRTPVMLQLRVRRCHMHGSFVTRENQRPPFTLQQAKENPARDTSRIVLPPADSGTTA